MNCCGFSLVEVLAAAAVLAAGMFGAAAGQAAAVRTRYDAALRSEAVQLAVTLAERMRANRRAADAYLPLEFVAAGEGAPAGGSDCAGTCDAEQLAASDIAQAKRVLAERFPRGRIVVCRDEQPWNAAQDAFVWPCADGPGAPIVIKIGWRERGEAGRGPRIVLPLGAS